MYKSIIFFYQPNVLRKSEANFFLSLIKYYPDSQITKDKFLVPQDRVNQTIDSQRLCNWLQADILLPPKKRQLCIDILQRCPPQLRIALHPKEISFDVVAQVDDRIFYWEFHEKQHVRLSNDRTKYIYSSGGDRIEVPRFFQRFVRDLWRTMYFRPYTVVWQNWFESSMNISECLKLADGYREFYQDNKFSFDKFILN